MENSRNANLNGVLVVKDADQLLRLYIGCGIAGFIAFVLALQALGSLFSFEIFTFIIWGIFAGIFSAVAWIIYKMIQSRKSGYIVDQNDRTLEFSAIGDADDVTDYFSKEFYKKIITRRKINLSEIHQMSSAVTTMRDNNGKASYLFHLDIQGSFGSIPLTFTTEGKRDQLMGYIRSINKMGIPIIQG